VRRSDRGRSRQVRAELDEYRALGIGTFILSGDPHRDEAERFARLVLDRDDERVR
jgi:alkanesulfonate monooxygenase